MIQRFSADMWHLRSRSDTGNVIVRLRFWRSRGVGEHTVQRVQRQLPAVLRFQHTLDGMEGGAVRT